MKSTILLSLLIHWQHSSLHLASSTFVSQTSSLTSFTKVAKGGTTTTNNIPIMNNSHLQRTRGSNHNNIVLQSQTQDDDVPIISKAPSFNGKTVFPMKVFMNGLKGHKVAAVFAVLNNDHKRG